MMQPLLLVGELIQPVVNDTAMTLSRCTLDSCDCFCLCAVLCCVACVLRCLCAVLLLQGGASSYNSQSLAGWLWWAYNENSMDT
jgi:hypothetical protein